MPEPAFARQVGDLLSGPKSSRAWRAVNVKTGIKGNGVDLQLARKYFDGHCKLLALQIFAPNILMLLKAGPVNDTSKLYDACTVSQISMNDHFY